MISALKGNVVSIAPGVVHIETQGGVVYEVRIPISIYSTLKNEKNTVLYTVLRVKEDLMLLYGFLTVKERAFFEKLTTVSGIGGRIALSLISAFSTNELIEAINNGDTSKISSIPGIGKKTAQRLVLELTGKLELDIEPEEGGESVQIREDLISALVNLGYPPKSVKDCVNKVMREQTEPKSFEEMFKLLLKQISKM